jgi:hypothetical protein
MSAEPRSLVLVRIVWILAGLLVVIAAGLHIFQSIHTSQFRFTTAYQAVLLSNGSVYFGHLQDYGTPTPVLTDVFYVVNQTDPETKQTKSSLIKRGKEMHEPDRMYLNPTKSCLSSQSDPTRNSLN